MPLKFIRRFTRSILLIPTILVAFLFVLACLASELNPVRWWFVGALSLLIPYLVIILVFAFIFWLITKPKASLIPLLALLIGWRQIKVVFSYHIFSNFETETKAPETIRLVSWNVASMYGISQQSANKKYDRKEIAATIRGLNPDIICLQEFNHSETQGQQANNIGLFSDAYPYHYFSKDVNKRNGYYQSGSIIFSKYPIIGAQKIQYPAGISESFIYADILHGMDTLRIFNVHLQSYKFSPEDYQDIKSIKQQSDSTLQASYSILKKMQLAYSRRAVQAGMIRKAADSTTLPSIICGDFNDVPASYAYVRIRGPHRYDAFLKKSWGIGRTYDAIAPTLRIDYILPQDRFNVQQFDLVDENLSDHMLLVADLSLKPAVKPAVEKDKKKS